MVVLCVSCLCACVCLQCLCVLFVLYGVLFYGLCVALLLMVLSVCVVVV